ncbi:MULTISPECIES: VOC family protein [unclassified Pseudofrankia]|uniref:VOC family protein n=1 Tax=unclassified Pseudofrankia TaxID=2994372 RepID=UPI0008D98D8D|nr:MULTISPECIES: VOC family protein [unclassified Pseudofrankia]MDT3445111.1 VOC family protein [Pseudofrankia sp. BMG5.37]OHV47348.1 glyoxalase [Pseudofrankia sp. BMG5.36]
MTSIPAGPPAPLAFQHHLFQQPWPEGEYRLFQLGFVVDDLVAAARRWATVFGVGPFHVLPPIEQACTYRGAATGVNLQVGVAQAGPVQIELITQRCDRDSIFREQALTGRAGFHQLCTVTPDYDSKRALYLGHGYELACELTSADGIRVGYFDTLDDFGFITEVVEQSPGFLEQLARIAATCAQWDGTDPVRLLTRNGYRVP